MIKKLKLVYKPKKWTIEDCEYVLSLYKEHPDGKWVYSKIKDDPRFNNKPMNPGSVASFRRNNEAFFIQEGIKTGKERKAEISRTSQRNTADLHHRSEASRNFLLKK